MGTLLVPAVGTQTQGLAAGDQQYETINATPLSVGLIPVEPNKSATIFVTVAASFDGATYYGGIVVGSWRRTSLGGVEIVGSASGNSIVNYDGAWSLLPPNNRPRVQFAAVATAGVVQVVGLAATTISWSVTLVQAKTR